MKKMNSCPKCGSSDVIRVPGRAGAYGTGNNIPYGPTIFSYIPVTRFVCGSCGYTEEWIESRGDVEKLRRKY